MISEKNDLFDGSSSSSYTANQVSRSSLVARTGRTLRMLVTQCRVAHVGKLDGALGARVAEEVAMDRVELGGGDDLCQLLHVDGLDVEDV